MKGNWRARCGREGSEEAEMAWGVGRVLCVVLLVVFSPFVRSGDAQQPAAATKVSQVKGLVGVKNNTGGHLGVEGGNLRFTHEAVKVDVATNSVEDVITGNDSERAIHGTLGNLTMLAPYGSGRFLSLFRTKLDSLTIKYRDADGGLHGAVFTMAVGKADELKKELLAQGAHTTVPMEEGATAAPAAKEQKP
jgi:hypothetical protein